MPSLVDGLSTCVWFESGEKRNSLISIASGFLFFIGWWLIIDANVTASSHFYKVYHICGIIGTISFFMVNSVSKAQVQGDIYSGGCMGPRGARLWLFVGFVLGFAAVIAASWILFAEFVSTSSDGKPVYWVGVALFLQNLFIFGSSLIFKFGRIEDQWG